MSSIYNTLKGYVAGSTLTLPSSAFGAGGIADVINTYFGKSLVIDNVVLVDTGSGATFSNATVQSAPLNTVVVNASFTQEASEVVMELTGTPPQDWNFATAWPLLTGAWITKMTLSNPSLVLTSKTSGNLEKGLNFEGEIGLGDDWSAFLWLVGGATSFKMSGPIGQTGAVPVFDFSADIGSQISIPPFLNNLDLSLKMACSAVASHVTNATATLDFDLNANDPIMPKWVPNLALGLFTDIKFNSTTDLPIFINLASPEGGVIITADISKVSKVVFSDFATLLPGVDFDSVLPDKQEYDPGTSFTFQELSFAIQSSPAQLSWVSVTLGTTVPWTVTKNISVGPIHMTFQIQPVSKSIAVTFDGLVSFTGGSIELGAYYPGFTFTGNLTEGSIINLTALMDKLLPIEIDAQLTLNELNFVVTPTKGDFSLITGLEGDWSIPVGLVNIDLTNAWLNLDRSSGDTSGAIGIKGNMTLKGEKDPICFDGSWALPGTFMFHAEFPDVNFTSIAETLSGHTLPDGVPEIALTKSAVAIALNTQEKEYTFSLATTATVNGSSLGTAVFQVRKDPSGYGYIVGFVIPESWSPGDIWSPLDSLFKGLSFSNSGVLISTLPKASDIDLPNMTMPSLPTTVNPGFLFFSTLSLSSGFLGPLQYLFKQGISFNLFAQVDTATPVNSVFKAILPLTQTNGSLEFKEVIVELRPAQTSFSITAEILLTVQSDQVTLKGTGEIKATPPTAAFTIEIDNWVEPLGIHGLTINEFGLQVKIEGAGVTIGFLGDFLIGKSPKQFEMVIGGELIDFEVPGAIIFELIDKDPNNPLMLSDLIEQFTSLDLSKVPVLNKIGFKDLEFWVVDDPSGFKIGDYTFPPGIGVVGDIFIYEWEAKFNIQVNANKGIIASGSINKPIGIAGVFSLSDTTGTKGPSGSINTTAFANPSVPIIQANTRLSQVSIVTDTTPYMSLDGKVSFLGLTESIKAEVSSSSFDFELDYNFLNAVSANLSCSLKDSSNFAASASCKFDLTVDVGPYKVGGVTLVPHVHIDGPGAAFSLAITVNPTVIAELSLGLQFTWASLPVFDLHFTISLKEIANDIANLYQAVLQWMKDNVGKVFEDLLNDVKAWINALKTVFSEIGKDISEVANALANYFKTGVEDAAAFLKELAFGFMDIVEALVKYFKIAFDKAVQIVEELWNDCSMGNAFNEAQVPGNDYISARDLEYEFTKSEKGQQLLMITQAHKDEIHGLLERHAGLYQKLNWCNSSRRGGHQLQTYVGIYITALKTVEPKSSPELKTGIANAIPILEEGMDKSHYEYLEYLKN